MRNGSSIKELDADTKGNTISLPYWWHSQLTTGAGADPLPLVVGKYQGPSKVSEVSKPVARKGG